MRDNNHLYELVTLCSFKSLHNIPSLTPSLSMSLPTNPHPLLSSSFIRFSPSLSLPLFHSLSHTLSLSYSPSSLSHTLSVSIYLSFSFSIYRSIFLFLPHSLHLSLWLTDFSCLTSRISSKVTRPAVPPYSSTTMAKCNLEKNN